MPHPRSALPAVRIATGGSAARGEQTSRNGQSHDPPASNDNYQTGRCAIGRCSMAKAARRRFPPDDIYAGLTPDLDESAQGRGPEVVPFDEADGLVEGALA